MLRSFALFIAGCLLCMACSGNRQQSLITTEGILEDLRSNAVKDVVIDSDTYNEMDDQYAIAYALASDRINVIALHAAPYFDPYNDRSTSFKDGMERSYKEICRVLEVTGNQGKSPVFKGAEHSIAEDPAGFDPDNPAARNLVQIARKARKPVYVLCLGMITNVAAALMLDPSIKDKIVIVWLGTHCFSKGDLDEFNLRQDYRAGLMVMNSGVPLDKHPLVYWEKGTVSADAHYQYPHDIINDAPCFMGVLHYKFIAADIEEYKKRASNDSTFAGNGAFYREYMNYYNEQKEKSLMYEGSVEFTSSGALNKIPVIDWRLP